MDRKSKGIFYLFCFVLLVVISRSIFKTDEKKENTVLSMEEDLAKVLKEKFESSIYIYSDGIEHDKENNYLHVSIYINNKKDNKKHLYEEDIQTADEVVTFIEEYILECSDSYVVKSRKSILFRGKRLSDGFGLSFHSDEGEVYFTRMYSDYICHLSDLGIFTKIKRLNFSGIIDDIKPIKQMKNLEYIYLSGLVDDEVYITKEYRKHCRAVKWFGRNNGNSVFIRITAIE